MRVRIVLLRLLAHVVLVVTALVVLAPLAWLVRAAFAGRNEMFAHAFVLSQPTLDNFRSLFDQVPFLRYLINSAFVRIKSTRFCKS